MKKIIDPVSTDLLKSQLTKDRFLRTTNHGGNEIYVVDNTNAPDVIREIGRLREEAFRAGGGGTGRELDIDKFSTDAAYGYKQLVLWDPDAERIMTRRQRHIRDFIIAYVPVLKEIYQKRT